MHNLSWVSVFLRRVLRKSMWHDYCFHFAVGECAFIADSLSRASRSAFRVKILRRYFFSGVARYEVKLARYSGTVVELEDRAFVVREDALDDAPHSHSAGVAYRERWRKKCGKRDKVIC